MVAYLDHAATTPVRPEALEAYLTAPAGNASSLHTTGRHARRVLEEARESLAEDLGIAPDDIIVTSGGTTADNLAIKGIATARVTEDPGRRLVAISAVEHHAVLDAAMALVDPSTSSAGFEIVELPVDGKARVRIDAVEALIAERADELALISVMSGEQRGRRGSNHRRDRANSRRCGHPAAQRRRTVRGLVGHARCSSRGGEHQRT